MNKTILAFVKFDDSKIIGVGRDGHIFTIDVSQTQTRVPRTSSLRDIDDIISI